MVVMDSRRGEMEREKTSSTKSLDIVESVEEWLDIKLLVPQKILLRKMWNIDLRFIPYWSRKIMHDDTLSLLMNKLWNR